MVNPFPSSGSITNFKASNQAGQVFQVTVQIVPDIKDHDFPQAKRTWEALIDAGIEPGDLVAQGLELGHGYQLKQHQAVSTFTNLRQHLMNESVSSNIQLIGYQFLESSDHFLPSQPDKKELILKEKNLAEVGEKRSIKLTAILRQISSVAKY